MFSIRRPVPLGCAVLTLSVLAASRGVAQNQVIRQPDFLQTLGVGARSVAMGEAYSAIGNDASAAFWNPGRLGFLQYAELQVDFRTVLNSQGTFTQALSGSVVESPAGLASGKLQSGFFGATYRLSRRDSIVLSNTLGGYYDNFTTTNVTSADPLGPPNATTTTITKQHTTVRNNFITLAYGNKIPLGREEDVIDPKDGKVLKHKHPAGFLGIGIAGFGVNQGFRRVDTVTQQNPSVDDERGLGYGASIGLAYDAPRTRQNTGLHVGLSYRTKVHLAGLKSDIGQAFNTEIPERLSFGVALDTQYSNGASLWISGEFQFLGAANRLADIVQQDQRRAVGDFHFGVEYTPFTSALYRLPLRLGFRTNSAAAVYYTSYDNVISLGFAYQGLHNGKITYSIEPTMEVLGSTGLSQYTVTGRVLF